MIRRNYSIIEISCLVITIITIGVIIMFGVVRLVQNGKIEKALQNYEKMLVGADEFFE